MTRTLTTTTNRKAATLAEAAANLGSGLLLSAASYEQRFLESLKRILDRVTVASVNLIVFDDYFRDPHNELTDRDREARRLYRENYDQAIKELERRGTSKCETRLDIDDVLAFATAAATFRDENLFVDISTFPRSYILAFLRFTTIQPRALIYTFGRNHRLGEGEFAIGVKQVITLAGFEGKVGHRPTLLAISLGFEGERAYSLVKRYEPLRTLAFIGDPGPDDDDRDEILRTVYRNNASLLDTDSVSWRELPSYDPTLFAQRADDVIQEVKADILTHDGSEVDVVLAPVGTKPQTIGLFDLWTMHPEYQIAYPVPSMRRLGTQDVGEPIVYLEQPQ